MNSQTADWSMGPITTRLTRDRDGIATRLRFTGCHIASPERGVLDVYLHQDGRVIVVSDDGWKDWGRRRRVRRVLIWAASALSTPGRGDDMTIAHDVEVHELGLQRAGSVERSVVA